MFFSRSRQMDAAARVVASGGVIAYPTEFVFGLGCSPWDAIAVDRVLRLKRRPQRKGFIVLASSLEQISGLIQWPERVPRETILCTWPGPVTWVFPCKPTAPVWLTGYHRSLAVRVTAHPIARQLCEITGPLVSTSANRTGQRPARTLLSAYRMFGRQVDMYLSGKVQFQGAGTEIRLAETGAVLRKNIQPIR